MRGRYQGLGFYERRRKVDFGLLRRILFYVVAGPVMVFLAWFVVEAFGFRISVIGDSMKPELSGGQSVCVDRLAYRLNGPEYGDVIAFYPGGNTGTHPYVKRVIGVPGDRIEIRDGVVRINGIPEKNADAYDLIEDPGIAGEEILLGGGQYFVLGDNRNNSEDSRFIGCIKISDVKGVAVLRLWPLNKFGTLKKEP